MFNRLHKGSERVADKLKTLANDLGDVNQVKKEGFAHTLQRIPMFRDKEEATQYIKDKDDDPERARVTLVVKQMTETIKNILR